MRSSLAHQDLAERGPCADLELPTLAVLARRTIDGDDPDARQSRQPRPEREEVERPLLDGDAGGDKRDAKDDDGRAHRLQDAGRRCSVLQLKGPLDETIRCRSAALAQLEDDPDPEREDLLDSGCLVANVRGRALDDREIDVPPFSIPADRTVGSLDRDFWQARGRVFRRRCRR
jgi:hypothetical protein